ncbi:hypothetical protein [Actinomadura sp. DC4]|uniref:hypothetical protein n=1 Tax=Actinomadura sp. DC4 TaxID=3055069 RepID=UPI0025AFD06D|nr:hypothetical protein [Actinomadura sp. DC4]MDN3356266.1 hypothetical protein [Actinomadura sp. DC4]
MTPGFFTPEWAEDVRAAVDHGPGEETRAAKLPGYWDWIANVRAGYASSWALGVRDLPTGGPSYLRLGWKDGTCAEAAIIGPDDPLDATYVLSADLSTWRALLGGQDPGRIVMYRGLRLTEGDVLRFFRGIYFFVESVALIARVPALLQ